MIIYDYLGQAKTFQKIVPGDTATGIGAEIYTYIEKKLNYDGGSTLMVAGDRINGATSGAHATVTQVVGDTTSGYVYLKAQVGTFQENEVIRKEGDATAAVVNEPAPSDGNSKPKDGNYEFKGCLAKAALISCEDQTALFTIDGTTPGQTYDTGTSIPSGGSYIITDINNVKNAKFIDHTSGSASTIKVVCFF